MSNCLLGRAVFFAAVASLAMAAAANADPVKLKLAMFSPDTEMTWVTSLKPWADAVNKDANGVIEIDLYPNGALGRALPQQPQMVLDGVADMAFAIPGVTPGRFPDNEVMDLPGLFRNMKEATLVYTRVINRDAMRGFENFFVIGAMGTPPFDIWSRAKVTSLADLKGKKIRVTNATQSLTMKQLGAVQILMPITEVAEAIGRGTIDGTTEFPGAGVDFGLDRVTKYDYRIGVGMSSLVFIMNKQKFDSLPKAGQDVIRKHSGDWFTDLYIAGYGKFNADMEAKLRANPNWVTTDPTKPDLAEAQAAFKQVIAEWQKKDPHNPELLKVVEEELAKVRGGS
jgi:TRAP-type C4-dicarboxylate transport system substrate-binding protein